MFGKQTSKHEKNPKNFEKNIKIQNHVVGSKSNLESNESNINLNWKKFIIFTPI